MALILKGNKDNVVKCLAQILVASRQLKQNLNQAMSSCKIIYPDTQQSV